MSMRRQPIMIRAAVICIFFSCIPAGAQIAPIPPGAQAPPDIMPDRLDWDWKRSQELSWKQSIGRTKNLSEAERNRLLAAIADQLSGYDFQSQEERKKATTDARIEYVTLGQSSRSEVIVQGGGTTLCSPTGNCSFWIFRRQGNSYAAVLETEAQTFTLQRSRNKGLLDIVLTRHSSASESEVKVYRFNGKSYKEDECYLAKWEELGADGEFHKLTAPKLTLCGARSTTDDSL